MVGRVGLGQDPTRQLPSPCPLAAAPPIRPVRADSSSPSLPGPASGQTVGWWVGGLVGVPGWEAPLFRL